MKSFFDHNFFYLWSTYPFKIKRKGHRRCNELLNVMIYPYVVFICNVNVISFGRIKKIFFFSKYFADPKKCSGVLYTGIQFWVWVFTHVILFQRHTFALLF